MIHQKSKEEKMHRFCLRYSQCIITSNSSFYFKVQNFQIQWRGGGRLGEGGGCKVWNRFCNNHPRGNFTALEICRWQFSRLRIVWMEISRVELVLVPIEYMSTDIFFMLTFNSSKLMFWNMLKETRNSFKKWHFTPHLNVKKL